MTRDEEILALLRRPGWWETRILPRILPEDEDGCRRWGGYINPRYGYGYVRLTGLRTPGGSLVSGRVHRVVYLHAHGSIPSEVLDHLCDNRACVEILHLSPATQQENILRGTGIAARNAAKETCLRGHPLTEDNLVPHRYARGERVCITCIRERDARYREKRRTVSNHPDELRQMMKREVTS